MLRFIADVGERLPEISKSFVADPRRAGGSMFRIYRDTRFSKDKSLFKPAAGAQFPHRVRGKERSSGLLRPPRAWSVRRWRRNLPPGRRGAPAHQTPDRREAKGLAGRPCDEDPDRGRRAEAGSSRLRP